MPLVSGDNPPRISKKKITGKEKRPKNMPKVAGSGTKSARERFMTPQPELKKRK